jgi:hypothetical protein
MSPVEYKDYHDVPPDRWPYPHIEIENWACHGSGYILWVPEHMELIEELRVRCGFPFLFTSGYRSPMHDAEVGTSSAPGRGPHTTGLACDLAISNPRLGILVDHARALGFTGFGYSQKSSQPYGSRFLHLDRCHPTYTIWSY